MFSEGLALLLERTRVEVTYNSLLLLQTHQRRVDIQKLYLVE